MALAISYNSLAVTNNVPTPFSASGGVPPYAWTVVGGGAGGTINSATGLYTAPPLSLSPTAPANGPDVIQVTDSVSATATITVMVSTPLELVADIISNQMGLGAGQVYLYNQKWNVPIDSLLYIAIGQLSCKPFSNNRAYGMVNGSYSETQSTNFQALLSIDIMSRGTAARDQKEQVIMALGSSYAESQMELNSFRVALIPSAFVNLSIVDGPSIPYRFNISAQLQYFVSQTTPVSYYDTFATPVISTND